MISNFPQRNLIKEWLKAGFIFEGKYNPTETGTPQGGVISPLLANIGLLCKRTRKEIKGMYGVEQEVLIKKLNPILRGLTNYYKGVVSKETFSYVSYRVWQYMQALGKA